MATRKNKSKGKSKGKKKRGKIKIKQSATIRPKQSNLTIDTTGLGHVPTIVPSNAVVFKIKVRRRGTQ